MINVAAPWNRTGHYMFVMWLLLLPSFFLSSSFPRLFSAVADWMSTIFPDMVHGLSADAGLKRAERGSLKIQDAKDRQKFAICAPSHTFVGLYLRN